MTFNELLALKPEDEVFDRVRRKQYVFVGIAKDLFVFLAKNDSRFAEKPFYVNDMPVSEALTNLMVVEVQ